MLRDRRIPDIFLGALLAVAVFALGFSVAFSLYPPQKNRPTQSAEQSGNTARSDDRLADYTLALDALNFFLVVSTVGLWWQARRSAKIAEHALLDLERACVVPGFKPVERDAPEWHVKVIVSNVGKSFALVKSLYVKFAPLGGLPTIPDPDGTYEERGPTDEVILPGQTITRFAPFKMPTKQEGQFIYGYILYEDVFERLWRNRFACQVWSFETTERPFYVTVGGRAHNSDTQEKQSS
jgi:hypothetical protein